MLFALVVFLFLAFAFSALEVRVGKCVWIVVVVLVVAFSLFVAEPSVSSVWVPQELSDTVWRKQDAFGEYQGTFPWNKLSYPFYLSVYHTPPEQIAYHDGNNVRAFGQVRLTIFFANINAHQIDGTFDFTPVMGPSPLHYKINLFSNPGDLFDFLVGFYTFVNIIGALIGIFIGRTLFLFLYKRVSTKE